MHAVIRRLTLKRFRSIPSDTVEFDNPTFLVGRNGSGKSNFGDAFSFLSDAMVLPLQAVFDKRGGISIVRNRTSGRSYPPNMGFRIDFHGINGNGGNGAYAFEIKALPNHGFEVLREQCLVMTENGSRFWFDRRREKFDSNVRGLDPSMDPASLGLPVVGGDARFAPVVKTLASMRIYSIEPAKIREMQDPDVGVSLRSDGGNAASVLQEIGRKSKDDLLRIGEILETIVPNTKRVRPIKHGKKLSLEFAQEWGEDKRLLLEAFSMSDGTLRALGLLMAVFQKPTPSVIIVEEPEATIHPGALGAILDILRHASRKMQVLVTTHSPEVLDAKWIQDQHLRIADWREGATRISPVSDSARKAIQEHLMGAGELLRSNALDVPPMFMEASRLPAGDLFDPLA